MGIQLIDGTRSSTRKFWAAPFTLPLIDRENDMPLCPGLSFGLVSS
jgi:hypothetical protein